MALLRLSREISFPRLGWKLREANSSHQLSRTDDLVQMFRTGRSAQIDKRAQESIKTCHPLQLIALREPVPTG